MDRGLSSVLPTCLPTTLRLLRTFHFRHSLSNLFAIGKSSSGSNFGKNRTLLCLPSPFTDRWSTSTAITLHIYFHAYMILHNPNANKFNHLVVSIGLAKMVGKADDDPMDWDLARVIKEFCTPDRTWTLNSPQLLRRWPDTASLADRLTKEDIDGALLLTTDEEELLSGLKIELMKHRTPVKFVLKQLRARSRGYQACLRALLPPTEVDSDIEMDDSHISRIRSPALTDASRPSPRNASSEAPHDVPVAQVSVEPLQKKKRRIAPTNISSVPVHEQAVPWLTDADTVKIFAPPEIKATPATIAPPAIITPPASNAPPTPVIYKPQNEIDASLFSRPGAYLGDGKLSATDILSPQLFDGSSHDLEMNDSFVFGRQAFPPGRRQQVNAVLKKSLLNPSSRLDDYVEAGDENLPLWGESEDEMDDETWEEYLKEEAEREKEKERAQAVPEKKTDLDEDAAKLIVQQIVADCKAQWRESKLPKCSQKAHLMWSDAHKAGTRKSQIAAAQADVRKLETRLDSLCEELVKNNYKNEAELRSMSESLEPTIYPIEYATWVIGILNSPTAPNRPSSRPREKRKPRVEQASDGEILTSDSEPEQEDDFVVDDNFNNDDPWTFEDDDGPRMDVKIDHDDQVGVEINHDQMDVDNDAPAVKPLNSFSQSFASSNGSIVMFDLTGLEDTPQRTQKSRDFVDLVSPTKSTSRSSQMTMDGRFSPDLASQTEFPFSDTAAIANMGTVHWQELGDWKRLVITLLSFWPDDRRNSVLQCVIELEVQQLWDKFIERAFHKPQRQNLEGSSSKELTGKFEDETALAFTRLFDHFTSSGSSKIEMYKAGMKEGERSLSDETAKKVKSKKQDFDSFCHFLKTIAPHFRKQPRLELTRSKRRNIADDEDYDFNDVDELDEDDLDHHDEPSPSKNRRREIKRDQAAQNLRVDAQNQLEEQERRRQVLREKLKGLDMIPRDQTRLIINESKQDHEGLIYVTESIGSRIKDHQIEGVQFMWNHVVSDSRQGCLLAHTMGLGKTMQIITLLVALAEAAKSEDPSVSCQVPEHLRESRTLILCPAGLVENWHDELLTWAPEMTLGLFRKVVSRQKEEVRAGEIRAWADHGGVLVMGYPMLNKAFQNDESQTLLFTRANIVIGDEAHNIKNPTAKISRVANGFDTTTRIALTGSPLANSVDEYHAMINWVAPNFLGPLTEFRQIYSFPIKEGLWKDVEPAQRRKATKMLKVLKDTVAPKVHRKTVAALKAGLLPPKKEFIIYLHMTPLQKSVYVAYVRGINAGDKSSIGLFSLIETLSLLLAHPKSLKARLENPNKPTKRQIDRGDYSAKELPAQLLSDILSLLASTNLETFKLSYKMMVLDKILDEARALEENTLIFSQHLPTLNYIENLCKLNQRDYSRIDGQTRTDTRQSLVKMFNKGKGQVFLISTRSGGEGLNIHGASRIVIFDSQFNPIHEQQAIGRAYRIGQTKPVTVYWLLCDETFEKILQNQSVFKMQLQSRIVDQKHPIAWAQKMSDYFREPREPVQQETASFKDKDTILKSVLETPDLAAGISSIDMTDTFEEEEPEEQMTAEDRAEAAHLVKLNLMRLTNPEEFERLRAQARVLPPFNEGQPIPMHMQQQQPERQTPVMDNTQRPVMPPFVAGQSMVPHTLDRDRHFTTVDRAQRNSLSPLRDGQPPQMAKLKQQLLAIDALPDVHAHARAEADRLLQQSTMQSNHKDLDSPRVGAPHGTLQDAFPQAHPQGRPQGSSQFAPFPSRPQDPSQSTYPLSLPQSYQQSQPQFYFQSTPQFHSHHLPPPTQHFPRPFPWPSPWPFQPRISADSLPPQPQPNPESSAFVAQNRASSVNGAVNDPTQRIQPNLLTDMRQPPSLPGTAIENRPMAMPVSGRRTAGSSNIPAINGAPIAPTMPMPRVDAQPIMGAGTGIRAPTPLSRVDTPDKVFEKALITVESKLPGSQKYARKIHAQVQSEVNNVGGSLAQQLKWTQLNHFAQDFAQVKALLEGSLTPSDVVHLDLEHLAARVQGINSSPAVAAPRQRQQARPRKGDDPDV